MSSPTDTTFFARLFDFDSEQVSVADLIHHLRVLAMDVEMVGIANGMAAMAAADLIESAWATNPTATRPGMLISVLRRIDHETWGEME